MSNVNTRLAAHLPDFLARNGFDATIQRQDRLAASDFDAGTLSWVDVATVKAVWDIRDRGRQGLRDGAPASDAVRTMTIAFRDDMKDTSASTALRVVVDEVAWPVLSSIPIGDRVGLRLTLEAGSRE